MVTVDFELLFNSISVGILFQDYEGRVIKVNRCASDLLEIPSDDLAKAVFPDSKFNLIHQDGTQLQTNEIPFYIALQSGESTSEITFGLENKKTKQCRWVSARSFPLLSKDNNVKKFIVTVFYDVTRYINHGTEFGGKKEFSSVLLESKKNGYSCYEELLHIKEIGFKKIQEIAKIGSWIYTSDKRLIWSEETYRIYNRSPENFIPTEESLIELIHPDDQPLIKEWVRACMAGEKPGELIFRVPYSDGSIHYISGRGELVTDKEGNLSYMVGTAQDITERIQTENSLRRERWRLASIIEATQMGTWEWYNKTNNVEINEMFARITGHTKEELVPFNNIKWKQLLHPEDITRTVQMVDRHIRGELPFYVNEYRIKHKNGNWIWVEDRGKVMCNKEGKPIYMFGTHTDITERKKAGETLRANERLLRSMLDSSVDYIYVKNIDLRLITCNKKYADFLGKDVNDLIGKTDIENGLSEEYVKGNPQKGIRGYEHDDLKVLSGQTVHITDEIYSTDDTVIYLDTIKLPLKNDAGKIIGLLGISRDITEQRKAEQKMMQMHELFTKLTRLVPGMLCQYKMFPDGHRAFPYSSPGIEEVFELNPEDVQEDSTLIFNRIYKEDQEKVRSTLLESARTLKVAKFEYRVNLPRKGERYHLSQAYPERQEDGSTLWYSIIMDITERKQYEKKLERQTERLRNLHRTDQQILSRKPLETIFKFTFEHLHYLINYTYANIAVFDSELKKVEKIFSSVDSRIEVKEGGGLNVGEFVNQEMFYKGRIETVENLGDAKTVTLPPIIKKENVGAYINIPLRSEENFIGVLNIVWESPHHISTEEEEIVSEISGQIAIAIETARLRNETRIYAQELEKRVSERTAQLEAANSELEAFSYSVSHDLRAPLRAVNGFTRMLVDGYSSLLDNEGKRICSVIQESAKQMGRLIDDLLAFSRAGRAKLTFSDVNSELIVKSVFFDITSDKEKKRIDFRVEPLPVAKGDPNLIKQVWTNLISNAVKFTSKKEKAVIRVSAESQDDMVVFSITDNGAGFDMNYADKLFGVFERLHSTKEFPGTGVGLAIVQRIILRHGGRIWAHGEVGKGATFSFTLKKKD